MRRVQSGYPVSGQEGTAIDGNVILRLPPQPRYLSIARLTAAALGNIAGLTLDRIDDLRLAVDEMAGSLMGRSVGGGPVVLLFWSGSDGLTVEGFIEASGSGEPPPPLPEMSRAVIGSLVDSLEIELGGAMPLIRLKMQKEPVRRAMVEGATDRGPARVAADQHVPKPSQRGSSPKDK